MQRTIVIAANLGGAALDDLKAWLGITRPNEDKMLVDLLRTSSAMCEAFIGQSPVEVTLEESLPVEAARSRMASRPVQTIMSIEALSDDGTRSTVDTDRYSIEVDGSGSAWVTIKSSLDARAIIVRATCGLAQDWNDVPSSLRHGIIRLAAYYYRDRDHEGTLEPPASVSALWRPWRDISLT